MKLGSAQLDRACGAILGTAAGDALGAAYEFGLATVGPDGPQMVGGGLGNFAPGEWTDDTTMAWAILDVAASGADLRSPEALTQIAQHFRDWYDAGPPDIGNQTRVVLGRSGSSPTGEAMTRVARELHEATGHTAGNGSLMRTSPVALAHLDSAQACAEAARAVSALTHDDERAQEACVLWSLAIRHAILTGECDVRVGLEFVDADYWEARLVEAETPGTRLTPNGWSVRALQAAWSAIARASRGSRDRTVSPIEAVLAEVIAIGDDTDTIAAIAGGLLGATYGASAVPAKWRRVLHGYPGITGERLVELAHLATGSGRVHGWPGVEHIDYTNWGSQPVLVRHPADDGVWLGNALSLDELPDEVTAVVSLCLVGSQQVLGGRHHVVFRLIDEADPAKNPNLEFVLADAAATVAALRDEGHQVFVHCVASQSRTPSVAVAYAMLRNASGYDEEFARVLEVLPDAWPNKEFRRVLRQWG